MIVPSVFKPSGQTIARFLASQTPRGVTYDTAGMTRHPLPPGFERNHLQFALGHGADVFQAARRALGEWRQFEVGWVEHHGPTGVQSGADHAVLIRLAGLWWLNACRVVYVLDEQAGVERAGYAYGTLPGHAESGEELFMVERRADNSVWYEILAYARPNQLGSHVGPGRWLLARLQKQFARDSAAALKRAIGSIV